MAAASVAAKAPRKPEARRPAAAETVSDSQRIPDEGAPSERTNEATGQGFQAATPVAGGEAHQNDGATVGLPVPIASFTI